ncbi:MAG TPA: phasin [Pseudolabrys sp.]|nr:phasin [Pseudolabrys sp.]
MTEATTQKTKAKETPKFEAPKFDIPTFEVPAVFREFAEKGLAQAKENYEKVKTLAEDTTDAIEDSYTNASKGASEYGLKLIANARANTNSAFDLLGSLMSAKSYAEVVELSTGYARQQFETLAAQAKELNAVAQKAGTETFEPIKEGFSAAVKKAA